MMIALEWDGVLALALIVLAFYFVRNIPAYVAAGGVIVAGFAAATCSSARGSHLSEWIVLVTGLPLCIFGLLIVRVMFIRSVSLGMLRSIELGTDDTFGEDIGGRLRDMRAFHLIRTVEGQNALTAFGALVSAVVAVFYATFRIKA